MTMFRFGIGDAVCTPLTDSLGNTLATPSPIKLGVIQEFSLDRDADQKLLYGQGNLPVDIARGKIKYAGKIKFAQYNGVLLYALVFAQGQTAGVNTLNVFDVATAVPATPYQVTVTPPNTGTFLFDLGVRDNNGIPMTRVASGPTTLQYSVTAGGQYTFAAADTGKTFYISYQYTATMAGFKNVSEGLQSMGSQARFRLDYQGTYNAKPARLTALNCVIGKSNLLSPKIDEHDLFEFDFMCFADPVTGQVISKTIAE